MGPKSKLPVEREGLIDGNPEKFYTFGDEIGTGKFAVCRYVTHKVTGEKYAAKIIKYDSDSLKFAIREFDFMKEMDMSHPGLVPLHEAYICRKYLILIMEAADGMTLLDYVGKRHTLNEDVVAGYIRQLCEVLAHMHERNAIHLDLRPTNIRFNSQNVLKLVDYNACRIIANKKAGAVVDVIGDTEFCPPEMLNFSPIQPGSDMWSVAINTYILLSGISPFFYEDEDEVVASVQKCKFAFDPDAFASITSEAKDFIKKCLIIAPEKRLTAKSALEHTWLSEDYAAVRKKSVLDIKDTLSETDERLYSEEEEDYIYGSFELRTFDEEEFISPEDSDEEE
jgi:serine/threonine protein kinase